MCLCVVHQVLEVREGDGLLSLLSSGIRQIDGKGERRVSFFTFSL